MAKKETWTTCEMENCLRPSEYRIWAQWTIMDWVEYWMCPGHAQEALDQLATHLVDGQRPLELTAAWTGTP